MLHETRVAWIGCRSYEESNLFTATSNLINYLGGMDRFIQPGQSVAIKPNLIAKKKPEDAVTTHPALVEAVVRLVQKAGGRPFIVDSPGGPASKTYLSAIYRTTGMEEVARRTGCGLSLDTAEQVVNHPAGKIVKQLTLLKVLLEADVIIGLPKLKTHCMTRYTGAVKLMYGAVPGLKKAEYHFKMQRLEEFSQLLLDINTLIPTGLSIMDGVVGMEGDGPTAGSPRSSGLLLASTNPYALDYICANLIGIEPAGLPLLTMARTQGLCPEPDQIKVLGDTLVRLNPPFRLPAHKKIDFNLPGPVKYFVNKMLPTPVFAPELCLGCGECQRCCPAGAITMDKGRPRLISGSCIRCFCCQELCPHRAVSIHQPWLGKKLLR